MKNLTPLYLPKVDTIPLSPEVGFFKIYFRDDVLYKLDSDGVETPVTELLESDPIFTASPAFGISNTNIGNWNTSYNWGNHATQGYLTQVVTDALYAGINHTHSFAQITGKPTTLDGYGITDPVVLTSASYNNPAWINTLNWSKIVGAPSIVTSTGTSNYLPKWLGGILTDSVIYENGGVGIGTGASVNVQSMLHVIGNATRTKSLLLDSTWDYQTSFSMKNGNFSTEFNLGGATKSVNEGGPGSLQVSMYNAATGAYRYPVTFFANGNVAFAGSQSSVPTDSGQALQVNGAIKQTSVISALLKTNASGVLVAAVAGTDYLSSISSANVIAALGYTPVTNARILTINGTAYDLTADRSWTVGDVLTTGTYANPSWITSLAWSKITGAPAFLTTEVDTLDTVTGRGSLTANAITVGGLTVATNLIYTDTVNGRVGIGTTTATQRVEIVSFDATIRMGAGYLNSTPAITLINSGASTYKAASLFAGQSYSGFLFDNSGTMRFGSAAKTAFTNNLVANSSETYIMTLVGATSNVLIGTTTDSGYKLDVNGTTRFTGNTYVASGDFQLDNDRSIRWKDSGGTFRRAILITALNDFQFGPIDAGWAGQTYFKSGTSMQFLVNGASGTFGTALTINTSGNVGIGIGSPAYKLDVSSTGTTVIRSYGDTVGRISLQNSSKHYSLSTQGTNLYVFDETAGISRVLINTNGDIGIGTTSPGEKLHVVGNGFFTSTTGASVSIGTGAQAGSNASPLYTNLNFRGYADTIKAQIKSYDVSSNASGGAMIFSVATTGDVLTEYMRITTVGRVGIGTTSPTRKLTVIDSTTAAGLAIDSSAQSDNYYIEASKAGSSRFSVYENSDVVYINAYGRMVLRANQIGGSTGFFGFLGGNLLINTSTDSGYKLNVNGTAFIGGVATFNSDANIAGNVATPQITARRYYQNPDGVPTVNLGAPTVTEMALFDEQFDNKTAFYNTSLVTFETYDGTTWTDITSTLSDTNKKKLLGGDAWSGIVIPYGTVQYRITFNPNNYVYINALYSFWSTNGHTTQVHIWKKHNSGSWEQHTSSSVQVGGWPAHLYLPFNTIPWHPLGTLGVHYHQVRIVFTPTWNATYPTNNINLNKVQLWGGYPAGKRNVFTVDELQGVSFPANVGVVGAITAGSLTVSGLVVASGGNSTNWNTAFGWGNHASAGYQTSTGTVANIASGTITDLNAAWTAPGTSINNGFRVYNYVDSATNKPASYDNANWLMNIYSHPSGGTASYGHQFAGSNTENIYIRSVSNGSFGSWRTLFHTGNVPTLGQVTSSGNSTSNTITVGRLNAYSAAATGVYSTMVSLDETTNNSSTHFGIDWRAAGSASFPWGVTSRISSLRDGGNSTFSLLFHTMTSGTLAENMRITGSGNVLIGTTTDAGYKLDVNGTARVQDHLYQASGKAIISLGNTVNLRSNLAGGSGYLVDVQSYNTLNGSNVEQGFMTLVGTYAPTSVSGTPSFNGIYLAPTVNQTGGANGNTRGLYINPTITSAASWRSIEWSNGAGWGLYGVGTANNFLAGSLGIGTISLTGLNLRVSKNITGSTSASAIRQDGQVQSDVTSVSIGYANNLNTQAAVFTLANYFHFTVSQTAFTGGSVVTNQMGYHVSNTLTGATNNYGFYGDIASGTGRWNLYMNGTANNYLEGDTGIGTNVFGTATKFTVGGSETAASAIARGVLVNTTLTASANNDVLVGLDINPAYTVGAFTGTISNSVRIYTPDRDGRALVIQRTTNHTGNILEFRKADNAITTRFDSNGNMYTYYILNAIGNASIDLSTSNQISFAGASPMMRLYTGTGNVVIQNGGTFTDAGYRLDVTGTGRYSVDNLTTTQAATGLILANNTAATSSVTQQNSPSLTFTGSAWVSGALKTHDIAIQSQPQTWDSTRMIWYKRLNGGTWLPFFGLRSDSTGQNSLFLYPVGYLKDGVGQTHSQGFAVANGSTATSSVQQFSPSFVVQGYGWNGTASTYISSSWLLAPEAGTTNYQGVSKFVYNDSLSNELIRFEFGERLGMWVNKLSLANYTTTINSYTTVTGSVTAASAIARGTYLNQTLVAAANNDVLVGLDINTTFTNGAFTGVSNVALRVNSGFTYLGGTLRISATTANPTGAGGFFVFDGSEMTNFSYDYGSTTYRALAYNGSLVRFLTAGTERARFAVTTGNLLINTTTDAGYKLDVNGTARVTGSTFRVGDASKYFEVYTDGSGYKQLRLFSAGNFETTLVSTSGGGLAGYNSGVFAWAFSASKLQILTVSSEGFSGYQPLNFNSNLYPANTTTPAYAFNVYTNSGSGITVKRLQMFNGDTGKVVLQETGGNVLIGSITDTGEKLQVNGSIKSTSLTVDGVVTSVAGVLTSIAGFTGMVNIQQPVPMPPITLDIQNGIVVNVM